MTELSTLEVLLQRKLAEMNVTFKKSHSTGDNSYPIEYILKYNNIQVIGPTLEIALVDFIGELVESGIEKRLSAIEATIQLFAVNTTNMRTEPPAKEDEEEPDLLLEDYEQAQAIRHEARNKGRQRH